MKIGMTRIFLEDGKSVPVTVLDVSGNTVTQIKTLKSDGYNGIQLGFGSKKKSRTTKSLAGHFLKASVGPLRRLKEFRVSQESSDESFPKVGVRPLYDGIPYVDLRNQQVSQASWKLR